MNFGLINFLRTYLVYLFATVYDTYGLGEVPISIMGIILTIMIPTTTAYAFIINTVLISGRYSKRFILASRSMIVSSSSSNQEELFNDMEIKNWQSGFEHYDNGFGPLTQQTIPTLLKDVNFPRDDTNLPSRLLDVATGPGFVLSCAIETILSERNDNGNIDDNQYHLTGLDITENFLSLAKQRIDAQLEEHKATNHIKVDYVKGSAESLPFDSDTFDSITCNFGILHFYQPATFLKESYRVLKPGGRISFSCWSPPARTEGFRISLESIAEAGNPNVQGLPSGPQFFDYGDSEQAQRQLDKVGFENIKSEELSHMSWNNVKDGMMLYDVLENGTSRTREVLLGQTANQTAAIQALMMTKYNQITDCGTRPLFMPALVSSGTKPC